MNCFIRLLLLFSCGLTMSAWAACHRDVNDPVSVSTITLPEQLLVNSSPYAPGEILYDSGFLAGSESEVAILDCNPIYYIGFFYQSAPQTGQDVGNYVYPTTVPGIGVRVITHNQTGPYDYLRAINNEWVKGQGSLEESDHTMRGSAYRLQLITTGGNIASGELTLPSPLARVEFREHRVNSSQGDVVSQLNVTSTSIDVRALGCAADVASLNFTMGDIQVSAFDATGKAGEVQQQVNLSCEPGTNATLSVIAATPAEGDTANNTGIALSNAGSAGVAKGVGVQLNLRGADYDSGENGIPINTPLQLCASHRTVDSEKGYRHFSGDIHNPDGCQRYVTLNFKANYYRTLPTITPGRANAAGTLNLTYN
ncbi:type 1 fimbrial protein [Atlantibacter sp. RC6]|uniref:type 1 fimbrial protein n=1 Tax=Atlantibacter sp. RC6 TaxID=2587036 RepID=UPI0016060D64|nr:type 1 fimbrial protein [Atlantibacter sp. RC6]MBB3324080.1 type 1 fimbria pilin [Atlantibacter sp. RC6]